jgi:aspartyl-tRNA(Asn)/glutamyl-tRNA(Gln) amidotransferase subunit A
MGSDCRVSAFRSPTLTFDSSAFDNYYLKALHLRTTLRKDFDALFNPSIDNGQAIDLVLHPTTPSIAPLLDSAGPGYAQDLLTTPASLAGLPALSVPCGLQDGWPRGVSLVGRWGDEHMLLDVGRQVELWTKDAS